MVVAAEAAVLALRPLVRRGEGGEAAAATAVLCCEAALGCVGINRKQHTAIQLLRRAEALTSIHFAEYEHRRAVRCWVFDSLA